jgi:hypothetical protein
MQHEQASAWSSARLSIRCLAGRGTGTAQSADVGADGSIGVVMAKPNGKQRARGRNAPRLCGVADGTLLGLDARYGDPIRLAGSGAGFAPTAFRVRRKP